MGIPLREVMKIYPFSRSKLIGGAGGLDRMVESSIWRRSWPPAMRTA